MGRVIAAGGEKKLAPSTSEFVREAVAEKTLLSTVMMVTVWPGGWTGVRWYHNGRVYRAISNIDYSRLPQMIEWEDEQSRYQLTIFATKMDAETTAELLAHGQFVVPQSFAASTKLTIVTGSQYIDLAPKDTALSDAETILTLTGLAGTAPDLDSVVTAEIDAQLVSNSANIDKLMVMVLPQRAVSVGIYRVVDPGSPPDFTGGWSHRRGDHRYVKRRL